MPLSFIIGGARSGKSSFALKLASKAQGPKAFIATMGPQDEEGRARVAAHKKERGPEWETFEEETAVPSLIRLLDGKYKTVLIDCLTLWVSNLMHKGLDMEEMTCGLISALKDSEMDIYLVSNEVGMGIVPENALARRFRDEAGRLNQRVAEAADEVYIVFAGIPLKIKGR